MLLLAGRICVFLLYGIVDMGFRAMQEEQLREAHLSEDINLDKLNNYVMQQMRQQSLQP